MIHILGFVTISLGIVGVIFSRLGATPVDAFNYYIYTLTPLSLGTIVIITGLVVALLAFIFSPTKDIIISIYQDKIKHHYEKIKIKKESRN